MDDDKEALIALGASFVFLALLLGGLYWANKVKCQRQWEGSGMPSEFRAFQGCRIKLKDGRWIPAQNYREL
jgi:hypothetical protein